MRKTQKIKRLWLAQSLAFAVFGRETAKFNQSGFIGVQFKIELLKTLNERLLKLLGLLLVFEAHHKVIAKSYDYYFARSMLLPPLVCPKVETVVKVHVRKQRADTAALRHAFLHLNFRSFFQYTGIQPLFDVPQDPFVRNPVLDKFHQPVVVDGIEGTHDTLPTSKVFPQKYV
jgi:hypothetical protein